MTSYDDTRKIILKSSPGVEIVHQNSGFEDFLGRDSFESHVVGYFPRKQGLGDDGG